jgi:hypothetical protein
MCGYLVVYLIRLVDPLIDCFLIASPLPGLHRLGEPFHVLGPHR